MMELTTYFSFLYKYNSFVSNGSLSSETILFKARLDTECGHFFLLGFEPWFATLWETNPIPLIFSLDYCFFIESTFCFRMSQKNCQNSKAVVTIPSIFFFSSLWRTLLFRGIKGEKVMVSGEGLKDKNIRDRSMVFFLPRKDKQFRSSGADHYTWSCT